MFVVLCFCYSGHSVAMIIVYSLTYVPVMAVSRSAKSSCSFVSVVVSRALEFASMNPKTRGKQPFGGLVHHHIPVHVGIITGKKNHYM